MRALAGEIADAAPTAGATTGRAATGAAGAPASGAAPAVGEPGAAGDGAASTGTDGGAICPIGTRRSTISTPFLPSVDGSFAAACWRIKSIASRILASRNSIFGIIMVLSLLVIRAVPVESLWNASPKAPTACPYW